MPASPSSSSCPTCGNRPTNKRDRDLLRDALATVWLAPNLGQPGALAERWHCDLCQLAGAELVLCPGCGDSVMISEGLTGQADVEASAVAGWLVGHGWIHHDGTWLCGNHRAEA
jgi:hypothetical protein